MVMTHKLKNYEGYTTPPTLHPPGSQQVQRQMWDLKVSTNLQTRLLLVQDPQSTIKSLQGAFAATLQEDPLYRLLHILSQPAVRRDVYSRRIVHLYRVPFQEFCVICRCYRGRPFSCLPRARPSEVLHSVCSGLHCSWNRALLPHSLQVPAAR